jgi:hypothetical protein
MSTNNSSSIAFLPVDNTQKNSFNFKELNKLLHEMVSIASKSIIEIDVSELNEELIQDSIIKAIESVYHKQDEKKVKAKRPKQALTSYILFCNANRTKVKEENSELDPKDLTRKLAEMWSELSPEEKQPYVEESKREAERLKNESGKEDSEEEVKKVKPEAKKPAEKAEVKKETKAEAKKPVEKAKAPVTVEEPKKGKAVKKSEVKAPAIQIDDEEPLLTEEPVKKGKTSKK